MRYVFPGERNRSALVLNQPSYAFQKCGLAGAIRSNEGDAFAGVDVDADAV
jgi:hypothetical protein